jgi:hypothetical protein
MQQKIQAQLAKSFFAVCANLVYDIQSVHRKITSSLVTVYFQPTSFLIGQYL